MDKNITKNSDFKQWLGDLKFRIRQSQIKAAIKVNSELLRLYWDLGHDIVVRQMDAAWGSSFFAQLSKALAVEFPEMKGFSERNLLYIKQFYLFYNQDVSISQQVAAKLQIAENNDVPIRPQVGDKLESPIPQQVVAELQIIENNDFPNRQQVVDDLKQHPIFQIPWGHHAQLTTNANPSTKLCFTSAKPLKTDGAAQC